MKDRVIFRVSSADEDNLVTILDAMRSIAGCYRDRYPTRTKAMREALRIAAMHLSGAVTSPVTAP